MTSDAYYQVGKSIVLDLSQNPEKAQLTLGQYENLFKNNDFQQLREINNTIRTLEIIGMIFSLLVKSEYHRQFTVSYYFQNEIIPPVELNQYKIYLNEQSQPYGFVTWAFINDSVQKDVHKTGGALKRHEWNQGENLFFNDWVAPFGGVRKLINDLTNNVFPDEIATSVRHNEKRQLTKVCRWYGKNRKI